MGLVALALLEPKWLWVRTRSTTTMITLISHNQHPQTYNGLRSSTVPGDICEKSRREELLKTKNEKHISDWSFLLVSGRFFQGHVINEINSLPCDIIPAFDP